MTMSLCPINCAPIVNGAKTPCGHLFEKSAIERWLQDHNNCPCCRGPITVNDLTDSQPVVRPSNPVENRVDDQSRALPNPRQPAPRRNPRANAMPNRPHGGNAPNRPRASLVQRQNRVIAQLEEQAMRARGGRVMPNIEDIDSKFARLVIAMGNDTDSIFALLDAGISPKEIVTMIEAQQTTDANRALI